MTQANLFDNPPLGTVNTPLSFAVIERANVAPRSETSAAAYQKIRPKANSIFLKILQRFSRDNSPVGADALADEIGENFITVRARVTNLKVYLKHVNNEAVSTFGGAQSRHCLNEKYAAVDFTKLEYLEIWKNK